MKFRIKFIKKRLIYFFTLKKTLSKLFNKKFR